MTTNISDFERGVGLAMLEYHQTQARAQAALVQALQALFEQDTGSVPVPKGEIQKKVLRAPGLAADAGMTAGEVAKQTEYDEANVYTVLSSLEKAGVLEVIEGSAPRRWRQTREHRRNRILLLSRLIPEGHWTTYGDFAIAVYGNWRMAVTIGSVASKSPAFVNPHRVIGSGGVIPQGWSDDQGNGPEECKRRLMEEGVDFPEDRADPSKFIGWQELKDRLEREEEGRET